MAVPKRPGFFADKDGPGLTLVLVALVVVAVLGAKYFGFAPKRDPGSSHEQQLQEQEPGDSAPMVIIYTAHPTENYAPSPPHAKGAGDVVSVASSLEEALRGRSLRPRLVAGNALTSWSQAFPEARRVLQPIVDTAGALGAILDIHRDAIESIVGDVENPYVADNLKFAEVVRSQLEALAPGITRGVKVLHENVNGDLHPRSLQMHIGDYTDNTMEEALAAVPIIAQAIAKVLEQGTD
jgi:hypothetical protein